MTKGKQTNGTERTSTFTEEGKKRFMAFFTTRSLEDGKKGKDMELGSPCMTSEN